MLSKPNRSRRDELLGFHPGERQGDIEAFSEISAESLRKLIEEGFVDPERRHHDSPKAIEFLQFIDRWPQVTIHGFVDQTQRDDARVVIEGVECDLEKVPLVLRDALREAFVWAFGDAAEYLDESDYLYAWWG